MNFLWRIRLTIDYKKLMVSYEKLKMQRNERIVWKKGSLSCFRTDIDGVFEIEKDGKKFVKLICER